MSRNACHICFSCAGLAPPWDVLLLFHLLTAFFLPLRVIEGSSYSVTLTRNKTVNVQETFSYTPVASSPILASNEH